MTSDDFVPWPGMRVRHIHTDRRATVDQPATGNQVWVRFDGDEQPLAQFLSNLRPLPVAELIEAYKAASDPDEVGLVAQNIVERLIAEKVLDRLAALDDQVRRLRELCVPADDYRADDPTSVEGGAAYVRLDGDEPVDESGRYAVSPMLAVAVSDVLATLDTVGAPAPAGPTSTPSVTPEQTWTDNDGRLHYQGCDGHRYCDTDPEDDRGSDVFECLANEEPCPQTHTRPCGGCWSPPVSTKAYLAAEHRAGVRLANARRGLTEADRLVRLGTFLPAWLEGHRGEYEAAQRALGAVHSTPTGLDPLPGGLHWGALDVVANDLHRRATNGLVSWDTRTEDDRGHWRSQARVLLAEIFAAGGE